MSDEVQVPEPSEQLLAVARRVTAPWLRRSIAAAAVHGGVDPAGWDDLDGAVAVHAGSLLDRLAALLATDVDEQRSNPLSVYRSAMAGPAEYLRARGVPEPARDPFGAERFPGDPYGLGPATWSDVDPDLHVPGLTWGAWKAKVVLDRRRAEGLR